jgi:integrase
MEAFLRHVKRAGEEKFSRLPTFLRPRKSQADRTFRIRQKNLHDLAVFLKDRGLGHLPVEELKPSHVHKWLEEKSWKNNTILTALTSIQAFLNWGVEKDHIERNPLQGRLRRPGAERRSDAAYLSETQIRALLSQCRHACERNVVMALNGTGVRPCELVGIQVRHFEKGSTWRVWGKGTKRKPTGERPVSLSPDLIEMSEQLARGRQPDQPLFRNSRGTAWTEDTLRSLFARLRRRCARAGVELPKEATPYALRHTFASRNAEQGQPIPLVAQQLGQTPEVYFNTYCHTNQAAVTKMMAGIKPLGAEIPPNAATVTNDAA